MTDYMPYKWIIGEWTEALRKVREYEREFYKRMLGSGVEVEEGDESNELGG